jgi:hypothetical protein
MNNIAYLEKHISEVSTLIESGRDKLSENPESMACSLSLVSLGKRLEELQHELHQEKEARELEIVEVRLKGKLAGFGSLPLRVLSELSRHLSDTLQKTSYKRWRGKETSGYLPKELIGLLDLRLAGIGPGSTKLYISGATNPNLFGESLMEDTLTGTFDLLEAERPEDLDNAITEYSSGGVTSLVRFLDTLNKHELEADVSWRTPSSQLISWNGTSQKINKLWLTLKQTEFLDPERISVSGEVVTLSSKGRGKLEMRDEHGREFSCKIPTRLSEAMKALKLGQRIECEIEKETHYNESTGFERSSFSLIKIGAIDTSQENNQSLLY